MDKNIASMGSMSATVQDGDVLEHAPVIDYPDALLRGMLNAYNTVSSSRSPYHEPPKLVITVMCEGSKRTVSIIRGGYIISHPGGNYRV